MTRTIVIYYCNCNYCNNKNNNSCQQEEHDIIDTKFPHWRGQEPNNNKWRWHESKQHKHKIVRLWWCRGWWCLRLCQVSQQNLNNSYSMLKSCKINHDLWMTFYLERQIVIVLIWSVFRGISRNRVWMIKTLIFIFVWRQIYLLTGVFCSFKLYYYHNHNKNDINFQVFFFNSTNIYLIFQ